MSDVLAFIVAAGAGQRFGGELPKVFAPLAGSPLLLWSLRAYDGCPVVDRLLLAVARDHLDRAAGIVAKAGLRKPVAVIPGGPRRQDTVFAGLQALQPAPPDIIAIHDGARPLVDRETILRSIDLARRAGACVTVAPVTDTLKQVNEQGIVVATPDRRGLWGAQTPQTFRYGLLWDCYQRIMAQGCEVTDDASVLELCGVPVCINPGSPTNIKITTRQDLDHAETLMRARGVTDPAPAPCWRIGTGYDVHALVPRRKLILGGVDIPHERGLMGHSDADVLCHAVCDALLGAAAAGDIGLLFPDTDARYEGANSLTLCSRVAEHLTMLGWAIANVDATIIAQRPRLAPHIPAMCDNLAAALRIERTRVSVKATTTERLGLTGREEGIAAQAVALLQRP